MPIPLIAMAAYAYAGRSLSVGDPFEASESDAKLLKLIGRAKDPEAKPKRQYHRRDLQAETS